MTPVGEAGGARLMIAVGERENSGRVVTAARPGTARYLRDMRSAGAFLTAASRARLLSVGVDLSCGGGWEAVNLLPPARSPSRWDPALAREVALSWSGWLAGAPLVALVGSRVASAFGVASLRDLGYGAPTMTTAGVRVVRLPHPSGLCRWWNDPGDVAWLGMVMVGLLGEEVARCRSSGGG